MSSTAMITALTWIPRGAARERPVRFELSEEEYSRIQRLAALEEAGERDQREADRRIFDDSEDSEADEGEDEENNAVMAALPAEYSMDTYDDEDIEAFKPKRGQFTGGAFGNEKKNGKGLNSLNAGLRNDDIEDDERVMIQEAHGVALAMDADSEDEDADDDQIRPTDSLLVVAMTEDEHSHLEVQLLNEDGHMYIHHDVALPEFPLCLAWLDCPPYRDGNAATGEAEAVGQNIVGNYVAVGTFQCGIEIWNLDVLDPIEPTAVLGGELVDEELVAYQRALKKTNRNKVKAGKAGKKQQRTLAGGVAAAVEGFEGVEQTEDGRVLQAGSHSDAVMCLAWNREYRQAIASGSADGTVKIWDVTTRTCSHTFYHHTDKVQCVSWHPTDAWMLASGSFDGTIAIIDCRTGAIMVTYTAPSDVESMQWDPHSKHHLYVSCEDGNILICDIRSASAADNTRQAPACTFRAHGKTVSSISFSASIPGFLVTASVDKTVRVWDTINMHASNAPVVVAGSKKDKKGKGKEAAAGGAAQEPKLIAQKSLNAGKLFSVSCFRDSSYVLAAGGDKGAVAVWLADELDALKAHFDSRIGADSELHTDTLRAKSSGSHGVSGDAAELAMIRERAFASKDDDGDDESDEEEEEVLREMQIHSDGESHDDGDGDDESWMDQEESARAPVSTKKGNKGKGGAASKPKKKKGGSKK
jgi:periodic tryptophan protein 1